MGIMEAVSLILSLVFALLAPFIYAEWYAAVLSLGVAPFALFTFSVFLMGLAAGSAAHRFLTRDIPGSIDDFSKPELERLCLSVGDGERPSGALVRSTDKIEMILISKGVYDIIEKKPIQADPGAYSIRCSLKPEWRRWVLRNKKRIQRRIREYSKK